MIHAASFEFFANHKIERALLEPVVNIVTLPCTLLDAYFCSHRRCRGWALLLRFLAPITIPGALRIEVSR